MPIADSVFISYRRSDSSDVTGRIYDRLAAHFGREAVFQDVDSIPYGVNFQAHLNQTVGGAQVVLAIIGPTWLDSIAAKAQDFQAKAEIADFSLALELPVLGLLRRFSLAQQQEVVRDWIIVELKTALTQDIPVIPVLVGGSSMPKSECLPSAIRGLASINCARVRPNPDFHIDMERLIRRLESILGASTSTMENSHNRTALKPYLWIMAAFLCVVLLFAVSSNNVIGIEGNRNNNNEIIISPQ